MATGTAWMDRRMMKPPITPWRRQGGRSPSRRAGSGAPGVVDGGAPTHVRILNRPCGVAPEWVRDAWIGCLLPLVEGECGWVECVDVSKAPMSRLSFWIARLSGRTFRMAGFAVPSKTVIGILALKSPEAAEWWRTNLPQFAEAELGFVFDSQACEPVTGPWR